MPRILVFSAFVAALTTQQPAPPALAPPRAKESTVQVRGCLQGQTLTLTEDPGFEVPGRKIDLKADRRLMRALKEHNGHLEEIVGVLKTQSRDSAVAVKEKRGEKTRVYVGVSESKPTRLEDLAARPVIEVRAFSDIGGKCR